MFTALSTIAVEQAKATKTTIKNVEQLLAYLATHPDATMRLQASDMVPNIHLDAPYLSEPGTRSQAPGHLFFVWLPQKNQPIRPNGAISTL